MNNYFSKAKELGSKGIMSAKSGYNKAKELTNKGVDATKKAIHDKKRQVAKDVLRELAYDVSDKDSKSLIRSWNIVDDKYAKGGRVEEGDKVTITTSSLGKAYLGMNGEVMPRKLLNDKYSIKLDNGMEMAFSKDEFKHNSINPKYKIGGGISDSYFERDYKKVKNHINEGIGNIDYSYVETTWENISNINYSLIEDKLIKRLKKDGLLNYSKGGGVDNKYAKEDKAMLHNQNKEIMHHSKEMEKIINKQKHIEPFVVAKMNRATTDLSDLTHYLDGDKKAKGGNLGFTYTIGGL